MMRVTNIKKILCQPAVIVGLVLTFVWLVSDFSARFVKEERAQKLMQTDYSFSDFVSRKLDKNQHEQLVSLFQPYIINTDSPEVNVAVQGLTSAEQAQQSGTLSEVFIDDNKLILKGIVQDKSNNERTALIQVTNVKTTEAKLERFYSHKLVFSYEMEILNSTQVQLSLMRPSQKQVIILTMFKVIKNEAAVN